MRTKVAIIITRLDLGGAQEVALETAARLDPERFDVRLLAGPGGQLDADARARLGARFVPVPALVHPVEPLKDLAALLWLRAYLVREGIEVVHTHSSKAGLLGRLAAWLARTPTVVHTVHGWSFNDFQPWAAFHFYRALERWLARITHRLVVVASGLRDKGLLQGVGRAHQYAVVRAGVDLPLWGSTPRDRGALKALVPGLRRHVVGVVANLKPQKAPLDFVRVAAEVCRRDRDADFVYVGDGPLKADAAALAARLGVAERVHFLGWRRDPHLLAAAFDVFLLPSLFEGLPCVFPQALSMGLPVVASAVDGAGEIVKEGVNGFLCQPRDVEAMADRVAVLLREPALRARLAAAARAGVPREFGYDAMAAKTAECYRL